MLQQRIRTIVVVALAMTTLVLAPVVAGSPDRTLDDRGESTVVASPGQPPGWRWGTG